MEDQSNGSLYSLQTIENMSASSKSSDVNFYVPYESKPYNVAIYIRLSSDDMYSESLSITNQKIILNEYVKDLNLPNPAVQTFVDNGYTGVNMGRPAVKEMLSLSGCGKINCIVVKDFSRFSRNALECGYYIERFFPLYNIRFISINERFDSDCYKGSTGGIDAAFKFLINENYSKDLSIKIKSARHIQMAAGESVSGIPVFGYRRNSTGKLEPDEEASKIVREIFEMALAGVPTAVIRDRLCMTACPTPLEYVRIKQGKDIIAKCLWDTDAIRRILTNEQYMGTYVSGKRESNRFGNGKAVYTKEKDWIRIANKHPAIIDENMFMKVQGLLKRRHTHSKKPRDYLLHGKVNCGGCGKALSYVPNTEPAYCCYNTAANPQAVCYKMKLLAKEFDDTVLTIIKKQAEIITVTQESKWHRKSGSSIQAAAEYEKQAAYIIKQSQNIYEQFVTGRLGKAEYLSLKSEYTSQLSELSNHISLINQTRNIKPESIKNTANEKAAAEKSKVSKVSTITKELTDMLIERIYVFPKYHIEIIWKTAAPTDYNF